MRNSQILLPVCISGLLFATDVSSRRRRASTRVQVGGGGGRRTLQTTFYFTFSHNHNVVTVCMKLDLNFPS